jgi:DNA-binding transcriptional MerR regulator
VRIGAVAEGSGVTPRTIRYYEEIGLLPCGERRKGEHREYADGDVERLRELTRLRDLLGLSLDELKQVIEAEETRAAIRRRLQKEDISDEERRRLLDQALPHVERQLELVRRRREELSVLEDELVAKRKRILALLRELSQ